MNTNTPESFWARIDVRRDGTCWDWTGSTDQKGYGLIRYHGRRLRAHRLAWELTNGPIPTGRVICHHCDNPPCCNPVHLFLGTVADNNLDSWQKGRKPRGEAVKNAKLTTSDVLAIRRRRGEPRAALAAEYGVRPDYINKIWKRLRWTHI